MENKKCLTLNLKSEYFDDIASGAKIEEYRAFTEYWMKRIYKAPFDKIILKRGYPSRGDTSRIIERPWRGYDVKTISHPHFGNKPIRVFVIKVN